MYLPELLDAATLYFSGEIALIDYITLVTAVYNSIVSLRLSQILLTPQNYDHALAQVLALD